MHNNVKIIPISIVLFIFIALLAMPYPLQALMPIDPGEREAVTADYEQVVPVRRDIPSESGLDTGGGGIKEIKKEKQRILEKAKWERPQVRKRPFETDQTMKKGPIMLRPKVEKEGYIEFMNQRSTKDMTAALVFLIGLYFLYRYMLKRLSK